MKNHLAPLLLILGATSATAAPSTYSLLKKQVCGADASGTFNRADFGVNYGQQYGFKQDVLLRIQVERVKVN